MKLVLFIVVVGVIALIIFGICALVKGMKLNHMLVTYNGRVCNYWEARLWPDEYIHGWVVKTAKFSPRIDIRTGVNSGATPIQAAELIDYLLETYPVTSSGATIRNSNERTYDQENRQTTIIWRFSKAPANGVTKATMQKMVDDLLATFDYIYVGKWPLEPQKHIDTHEQKAKQYIYDDLVRKGLI